MTVPAGIERPVRFQTFYVTFGVQYSREPHPSGRTWIHPDGWLEVVAPDEETARRMVVSLLGNAWAFIYEEGRLRKDYHPRGPLALLGWLPPHERDGGAAQRALELGYEVLQDDDPPGMRMSLTVHVEDD